MYRKGIGFFLIPLIMIITGCGSTETSLEKQKENNNYVFDELTPQKESTIAQSSIEPPQLNVKYFIVQIGAFTTKEKAEAFSEKSKKVLKKELNIVRSDENNLFVVQITPFYSTKEEAEEERTALWQKKDYKDAWIVTVNK